MTLQYPQASESKGMRLSQAEHAVIRAAIADSAEIVHPGVLVPEPPISDAQVRDQDSLFGCLPIAPEEKM